MTLRQFVFSQAFVALITLIVIGKRSKIKGEDFFFFLIAAPVMGFLLMAGIPIPVAFEPFRIPLGLIIGGGFSYIICLDRKNRTMISEGGLALLTITAFYASLEFPPSQQKLMLTLATPLALFLIWSIFSSSTLSPIFQSILSALFSVCGIWISFYQVSFFDDFYTLMFEKRSFYNLAYLFQTFTMQVCVFWGFFHLSRAYHLIPLDWKGGWKGFKQVFFQRWPEFADLVSTQNIPRSNILLAMGIHVVPLICNEIIPFAPRFVLVSYAVALSPLIADRITRYFLPIEMRKNSKTIKSA